MTNREQLIQELEQAPDDLVQTVLDFLHRVKAIRKNHPLEKFAGILSDSEAEELQQTITKECRVVSQYPSNLARDQYEFLSELMAKTAIVENYTQE